MKWLLEALGPLGIAALGLGAIIPFLWALETEDPEAIPFVLSLPFLITIAAVLETF